MYGTFRIIEQVVWDAITEYPEQFILLIQIDAYRGALVLNIPPSNSYTVTVTRKSLIDLKRPVLLVWSILLQAQN